MNKLYYIIYLQYVYTKEPTFHPSKTSLDRDTATQRINFIILCYTKFTTFYVFIRHTRTT